MTAKELAEKICQMITHQKYTGFGIGMLTHDLESLLTAALEEAKAELAFKQADLCEDHDKALKEAKAAAYQEGYRKAFSEVMKGTPEEINEIQLEALAEHKADIAEAYEDAAKIVEKGATSYGDELMCIMQDRADAIRAKAEEAGK
jgi:hypothetical protein